MPDNKRTKRQRLSPEEFVKLWQQSSSVTEICMSTGLNKLTIRARACRYRKIGVALKDMPRPKHLNVERLNEIARKT